MKAAVAGSLLLVLCAVLIGSSSATGECGTGLLFCPGINQCYSQSNYGCIPQPSGGGSFLCPAQHCLCGQIACFLTSQYGCKGGQLTQDKSVQEGRCPGGSGGDPLMRGFDGCRWYLNGAADKVYNLVSGPDDTVNTLLVPANLTDAHHQGNGTYHGGLSFRHRDHIVQASVSADGNLTVTVDGAVQPFDSRFTVGDIKGKVVQHMPFFGQYVEVSTPSFTYAVQAVQPVTSEAGVQRGHADIDITLRKPVASLHGLLGQSYQNVQATPVCSEDYAFTGEGKEEDYIVAELTSVPVRAKDGSAAVRISRKLIEDELASFPLSATTRA